MKNPFDYSVSLRITHPTLAAAELCRGVNREAEFSWSVGEQRRTPKGAPLLGVREESYCSFQLRRDGRDGELARCLSEAVDALERSKGFLDDLRSTGGSVEFYCFWYPNGDTGEVFDPRLLRRMADLNIGLGINVLDLEDAFST